MLLPEDKVEESKKKEIPPEAPRENDPPGIPHSNELLLMLGELHLNTGCCP